MPAEPEVVVTHGTAPLPAAGVWSRLVAVLGASAAALLLAPLPAMLTVAALLVVFVPRDEPPDRERPAAHGRCRGPGRERDR